MIDVNRHIPGTIKVEGREFLYILDNGEDFFVGKKRSKRESLFSKITCLSENCKIWLPTGELFHGVSYKGDIEGWREGIIQAAIHLGLLTAKIVKENIEISDGRKYALSECKVEFY